VEEEQCFRLEAVFIYFGPSNFVYNTPGTSQMGMIHVRGQWLGSGCLKMLHSAFALSRCVLINSSTLPGGSFEVGWLVFKGDEWKAEVHVGRLVTGMLGSGLLSVTCHCEVFKFHFCN